MTDPPPHNLPVLAHRGIVIAALRRNGIDPRKALAHAPTLALCGAWVRNEMDADGFDARCADMLVVEPRLRVE